MNKKTKLILEKLMSAVREEGIPESVSRAAADLGKHLEGTKSKGLKAPFLDKNGEFSTTRTAAFVTNAVFLGMFILLGLTAGNVIDIGLFKNGMTIPEFPATAAGALALIVNGTYAYKHKTNMENGNEHG